MVRPRYHHCTDVSQERFLIHIGGLQTSRPYVLVEYTDLSTNRAQIGTIINPSNGPPRIYAGCVYLEGNVIVYVGGRENSVNGMNGTVYAPFLSLLQIQEPGSGMLQFKWVTGTSMPTPEPRKGDDVAKAHPRRPVMTSTFVFARKRRLDAFAPLSDLDEPAEVDSVLAKLVSADPSADPLFLPGNAYPLAGDAKAIGAAECDNADRAVESTLDRLYLPGAVMAAPD
ncbi:hypothetical protein AMAG_14064 [Allomyces macrogynus ATCC 38327]|uniref:Uncharacterized protein n=1 Tax=Allomyces macrogynus (strain ATCC 38327) TaxID=578462 RepID=A0A0L0T3X5_ALLM3|nr:hypothetical protein AMAG_14064 [Allomyces macrogynus ATCC 38327]|eukprot:KNE69498.1 hypothetical protein AMAG_14064 [Allomyces macrogynus ATCC 38327]